MKKPLFIILYFFLNADTAFSGNIAILDLGGDIGYTNSISNRVISKRCYSENDVPRDEVRQIGQDEDIRHYYKYKVASGCPNKEAYQLSVGERLIADRNTFSSNDVFVTLQENHLSDMTYIALQYTSQNVSLVSTGSFLPVENSAYEYVSAASLEARSKLFDVSKGLDHIIANRQRNNTRVVNISMGGGLLYSGTSNCDGFFYGSEIADIEDKINILQRNGVAIVVATGNNHPTGVQHATAFPACLRGVISVGAYYTSGGRGYIYGARSGSHSYVEQFNHGSFNNRVSDGTSPAAAKISGLISELMAINPSLSTQTILNKLRSTADDTGRLYVPNTNLNNYVQGRFLPNFARAKIAVQNTPTTTDQNDQPLDLRTDTEDTGSYGSDFGTNIHPDSLRILFDATGSSSNKLSIAASSPQNTYYRLRLQAYDIDTTDEIEIFLNGVSQGYLPVTANNTLSDYIDYYFELSELFTDQSNIITLKQKNSGERWGAKNISISKILATACDITPVEDNNQTIIAGTATSSNDEIYYTDTQTHNFCNGSQRYNYNFKVDLDNVDSTSTPPRRDILLNFNVSTTNSVANGLNIEINGFQNSNISNITGSHNLSVVINRKFLINGNNTITITPTDKTPTNSQNLNINNISAHFLPIIPIYIDQTLTQLYGYNLNPHRYTSLRLSFNASDTENDLLLSATGWDIDRIDETSVYINDIYYGHLTQSGNNTFNNDNAFEIKKEDLVLGVNSIKFIQRYPSGTWSGYEDEKWAVKDITLEKISNVVIAPIIMLLLDD